MSFFHFLNFVMNFLKGILSICHSFRNTCQPGRINGFDRCFQVVDRCTARRHELVTPVLAKTQILNFYQPHMEKQKPKTSIIAQTSTKVVDSLHARICLRTCNLLDSYYLKIIFSEPSLDIRTSSFVSNYYLRKNLKQNFPCNDKHCCGLAAILCERISCRSKIVKQVKRRRDREPSRLPKKIIRSTSETT